MDKSFDYVVVGAGSAGCVIKTDFLKMVKIQY